MVIFAYPNTLFHLSVEAVGIYVTKLMRRLITDSTHRRGPDGKYHHHQEPCSRLQEYITCYVPPNVASDITQRLMRHVSLCYTELINGTFKIACEEIAPHVIKAVIHPSVKCLDFICDSSHPTMLDYYKEMEYDLLFRTLPLLRDLKVLRLGRMVRLFDIPVEVEGFRNSLEEFSCRNFWTRDLATVAEKCKYIKCLDIGVSINYPSRTFYYISRFKYLEELNLSRFTFLSEGELHNILLWLAGIIPSDEESSEEQDNFRTRTVDSSQEGGNSSGAEGSRTCPARSVGLLKTFGCLNATEEHIDLISQFYNLTSLVLSNTVSLRTLAPLGNLKHLKNFTLIKCAFRDVEEVLKPIGNQLICLRLVDVSNTDLSFISHNCLSLECLHLVFSFPDQLLLPGDTPHSDSGSEQILGFPHVVSLHLYLTDSVARVQVLNQFPNLKKLILPSTGDDSVLLESLIKRTMLTRLEELHWASDTVIHINGNTVTMTVFHFNGEVTVQHIRTV
jgi:hypothetical protein